MTKRNAPPGITRRHSRPCPSRTGEACSCRPTYQAQAGRRGARQTRTFPTLAAALAWKRDVDTATARGTGTRDRPPTVREAAERWLTQAEAGVVRARGDRPYRPSTLRGYRRELENRLYPELGAQPLDRVRRARLVALVGQLTGEGLSASTVRNVLMPLRAIYRQAVDLELVAANPTLGLRMPAPNRGRERYATPVEMRKLLMALEEHDRPVWATAAYAGLRRGELMALRWEDVDLATRVIRVRRSYDPATRQAGEPKSDAGRRTVPIPGDLRDLLVAHRARAGRGQGLVFPRSSIAGTPRGDGRVPFSDQALGERAGRRWHRAGLLPIGLHECRHTYASLLIAAGANAKAVQTFMGHSTVSLTFDRYGHLMAGAEQEVAALLDDFLARDDTPTPIVVPSVAESVR